METPAEIETGLEKLNHLVNKIKNHPWFSRAVVILFVSIIIYIVPKWQVAQFEIDNITTQAELENKYRATLAQAIAGFALLIGLFATWRRISATEESIDIAREGQITERFTRAIDQLGNKEMEIRLGGIYALERISKESEKDYWSIMEILTAYVRKNSNAEEIEKENEKAQKKGQEIKKISLDTQAILTVLRRRKFSFGKGELESLNLSRTYLYGANLKGANFEEVNFEEANLNRAHLEGAHLEGVHLEGAYLEEAHLDEARLEGAYLKRAHLDEARLEGAHLEGAHLEGAHLERAYLKRAHLEGAHLEGSLLWLTCLDEARLEGAHLDEARLEGAHLERAYLKRAYLKRAYLKRAHLEGAHLEEAHLEGAHLEGAYLEEAHLEGAHLEGTLNLSLEQLMEVKSLYAAKLDEKLLYSLKESKPSIFEKNF